MKKSVYMCIFNYWDNQAKVNSFDQLIPLLFVCIALKQRAQIAPGQFGSTKRLLKYAIRHEGFSSLFRSFPVTLVSEIE